MGLCALSVVPVGVRVACTVCERVGCDLRADSVNDSAGNGYLCELMQMRGLVVGPIGCTSRNVRVIRVAFAQWRYRSQ